MAKDSILFYLTPKSQVAFCLDNFTLRQVVEKMDYHHYTAMPILNKEGKYVGTITEGDLLWTIRERNSLNYQASEQIPLQEINLKRKYKTVNISSSISNLLETVENQNYVPVVDDNGIFIGIVTRKSVLKELAKLIQDKKE